jgi:cytochrome b561
MTILAITLLRIIWRMISPPPPQVAAERLEKLAARLGHLVLYITLFGMPISGYIRSAAANRPVALFGLKLPAVVPIDPQLAHAAAFVHDAGQWILYVMVTAHILATLFHAIIRKDGVPQRMLPRFVAR